jgi:hypothetical protein
MANSFDIGAIVGIELLRSLFSLSLGIENIACALRSLGSHGIAAIVSLFDEIMLSGGHWSFVLLQLILPPKHEGHLLFAFDDSRRPIGMAGERAPR